MSKISWPAFITLGLAATILLSYYGWQQLEIYRIEHANQRNDLAKFSAENPEEVWKVCTDQSSNFSTALKCMAVSADATREAQLSKYDLQAQQEMAEWAFALLLLGVAGTFSSIAGLIALFLSLAQTRAAIRDNRVLGEAQTRAYVHVDSAVLRWGDSLGSNPSFTLTAINTGQTPAKWFECNATVFTRPLDTAGLHSHSMSFDDIDLQNVAAHRWNALGGGGQLTFHAGTKSIDVARAAYGRKDVSLDIAGIVKYETFFGEIFESEFWFTRRPPPGFSSIKAPNQNGLAILFTEEPRPMQRAAGSFKAYHRVYPDG